MNLTYILWGLSIGSVVFSLFADKAVWIKRIGGVFFLSYLLFIPYYLQVITSNMDANFSVISDALQYFAQHMGIGS